MPLHQRIWDVVRQIPPGEVATYGQVAQIAGRCTPRMVGYALAALPAGTDVPWHRVINSQGQISPRRQGDGSRHQRRLLEREGVQFDSEGRIDLEEYGWVRF